jgi:hypothetical protein
MSWRRKAMLRAAPCFSGGGKPKRWHRRKRSPFFVPRSSFFVLVLSLRSSFSFLLPVPDERERGKKKEKEKENENEERKTREKGGVTPF